MIKVEDGIATMDGSGAGCLKELSAILNLVLIRTLGFTEDEAIAFVKSVYFVYGGKK